MVLVDGTEEGKSKAGVDDGVGIPKACRYLFFFLLFLLFLLLVLFLLFLVWLLFSRFLSDLSPFSYFFHFFYFTFFSTNILPVKSLWFVFFTPYWL